MKKKKNWIVRMECVVIKEVYVDNCTEQQAMNDPFEYATNEREIGTRNWEVLQVSINE